MKPKTSRTIGYFSSFFFLGTVIAILGPTLPALAENLGVKPTDLGYIFSVRSLGYLAGSLLGGYLYERIRGHRVMAAALVLAALTLFLTPLDHLLILLIISLFFTGLGLGSLDIGSNTMLSTLYGDDSGPYLNSMYLLAGLGSFSAPLLIRALSVRWGYWALGILGLAVSGWLLGTPSPFPQKETSPEADDVSHLPTLLLFCLLSFLFIGIEISYGGWIFTYFRAQNLGAETAAYTLTSLFYLSITVGRLLSIPVSTALKPSWNVFGLLFGGAVSTGLMLAYPRQPWSIWIGTSGMGLSLSALFPTTFHYIRESFSLKTSSYGTVWASGSLGGILIPWVMGEVVDSGGPVSLMAITSLAWGLALAVFALLALRKRVS